jgi:hypothetical protein
MADSRDVSVDKVARARELCRVRAARFRAAKKGRPCPGAAAEARYARPIDVCVTPDLMDIEACEVYRGRTLACSAAADLLAAGKTAVPLQLQQSDPVAFFDVTLSRWREARVLAMITCPLGVIKGCKLSDVPAYASHMPWDYLRDLRPFAHLLSLFERPMAPLEAIAPLPALPAA